MFKKIIFLACILSNDTAFSTNSETLTPQEIKIYNSIKQQYQNIHNIDEMEKFLQKNGIYSEQLYQILSKKNKALSQEDNNLWWYLRSLDDSTVTNSIMKSLANLLPSPGYSSIPGASGVAYAVMILGPAIIGIPALMIGATMKTLMTPSTTKNIISSGLMGAGGLLSTPAALVTLGITASIVEKKVKGAIYRKNAKQKQLSEINTEQNIVLSIMQKLKNFYPTLSSTYQ